MSVLIPLPTSIVSEYEAGATPDELARRYGCSAQTVDKRLRAMGCRFRKPGRRKGDPSNTGGH